MMKGKVIGSMNLGRSVMNDHAYTVLYQFVIESIRVNLFSELFFIRSHDALSYS